MGYIYFSDKELIELNSNKYVEKATTKQIIYTTEFKEHFMSEYYSGKLPRVIMEESGFDLEVIGIKRAEQCAARFKRLEKRIEGYKDLRHTSGGAPLLRKLTNEEIIERQKAEIEYLKQERNFLLEMERLERQAIKKKKLKPKKNTK